MSRFSITEARARFCFHPCVRHTVMSERRAAVMLAEAVGQEGHQARLPVNREEGRAPPSLLTAEVVLPLIDSGLGVEDIAVRLGVSPFTVRDRMRMWRPHRRTRIPKQPIAEIVEGVAADTGVDVAELLGDTRGTPGVSRARQRAMMLAADAGHHEEAIARAFGRHRTTVLQGIAAARGREGAA